MKKPSIAFMKTANSFHFYTRLSPEEVLRRLGLSAHSNQPGSFYGEVKHNIFTLHCRLGAEDNHPLVSGYVRQEGEGARVHARVSVSYTQEFNAKFAGALLLLLVVAMVLMNWDMVFVPRDGQALFLSLWELVLLISTLLMVAVPVGLGWRHIRRFRTREMLQAMASLKTLLEADEV
jgi:hypothetical protein